MNDQHCCQNRILTAADQHITSTLTHQHYNINTTPHPSTSAGERSTLFPKPRSHCSRSTHLFEYTAENDATVQIVRVLRIAPFAFEKKRAITVKSRFVCLWFSHLRVDAISIKLSI